MLTGLVSLLAIQTLVCAPSNNKALTILSNLFLLYFTAIELPWLLYGLLSNSKDKRKLALNDLGSGVLYHDGSPNIPSPFPAVAPFMVSLLSLPGHSMKHGILEVSYQTQIQIYHIVYIYIYSYIVTGTYFRTCLSQRESSGTHSGSRRGP